MIDKLSKKATAADYDIYTRMRRRQTRVHPASRANRDIKTGDIAVLVDGLNAIDKELELLIDLLQGS